MILFWATAVVATIVCGGLLGCLLILVVRTLREVTGYDEESTRTYCAACGDLGQEGGCCVCGK